MEGAIPRITSLLLVTLLMLFQTVALAESPDSIQSGEMDTAMSISEIPPETANINLDPEMMMKENTLNDNERFTVMPDSILPSFMQQDATGYSPLRLTDEHLSDLPIIPEPSRAYFPDTIHTTRHIIWNPMHPYRQDALRHHHKAFWRAAAEVFGFNILLWSFDRYVVKGFYAYISWETIKENFKHGFEWDDDYLATNMFNHPYMGSLYYNAGRSNGFNFWQSTLFSIAGSSMWELFMENEYPSTNDVIATPIGGAAFGEVFYRTSDLIIDDRATGAERFFRELAVTAISPMRGFTRIVTGRAWKKRTTRGRRFGMPPISADLSLGMRYLSMPGRYGASRAGLALQLLIQYGDKYSDYSKEPYDYFSLLVELNAIKTQPVLSRIEIVGRLLTRPIVDKPKTHLSIGLYQHFDYFDSDTISSKTPANAGTPCTVPYKMGVPACVGGGLMFRYLPEHRTRFESYFHLNAVPIAGILTDFYRDYHRNYNWGTGFSTKIGFTLSLANNLVHISAANQFYWLFTKNGKHSFDDLSLLPEGEPTGLAGDNSTAWFNHVEGKVSVKLFDRCYASVAVDFYNRRTRYGEADFKSPQRSHSAPLTIKSSQFGCHIMFTYKL